jgi:hypothetical protein
MSQDNRTIEISVVMPAIAWSGMFERCARRVIEILDASPWAGELVVAFHGPAVDRPDWLRHPKVTVVATGVRSGPAAARNLAVRSARGRLIMFVDADALLAHGTLERTHARLHADAELAGVFGCVCDMAAHPSIASRFWTLLHHHRHASGPGPVTTIWAGCGAIRRGVLESLGGFHTGYGRLGIEGIELGIRATAAGHRIELDPALWGERFTRWTLKSMVLTDIAQRAMPWARQMLADGTRPAGPTVAWRSCAGGIVATLAALSLAVAPFMPSMLLATLLLVVLAVALNAGFLRLCARAGGVALACACVPLHLLYLLYSTVAFAAVALVTRPAPSLLVAYLGMVASVTVVLGIGGSWTQEMDGDLQERALEYASFRDGLYPNARMDPPPSGTPGRYSVYLPYAFTLFAAVFEPAGLAQARIVVALLSVAGLAAMGIYGVRVLSPHGFAWAAVGALAAAGITINRSTLAQGQFAIICMGFVALQMILLQRHRPVLAGACWALAMLKPHVGVAFAALFLLNRQWRGLVTGLALLAALSLVALWWTAVPPAALLAEWMAGSTMRFTAEPEGASPARFAEWFGWDPGVMQQAAIALAAVALSAMAVAVRRVRIASLLVPAAICAVLGRLLIYHRPYDQVMLWPLVLACVWLALSLRTIVSIVLGVAVACTLWAPLRLQLMLPFAHVIQPAIWTLAATYLACWLVASERRRWLQR